MWDTSAGGVRPNWDTPAGGVCPSRDISAGGVCPRFGWGQRVLEAAVKKRSVWAALVGLLVALVLVSCGVPEAAGEKPGAAAGAGKVDGVRVSCIDVGKGDAILVQSGESAMLIDTGNTWLNLAWRTFLLLLLIAVVVKREGILTAIRHRR